MKKRVSTILIILVFAVGLLVMLYPTISNWYNQLSNSYVLSNYDSTVKGKTEAEFDAMLQEAREYNQQLHRLPPDYTTGAPLDTHYIETMDVLNGIMGYIVIDQLDINLAVYHGTDESVLQTGVGHLEGSSLPTGDLGNHTVLTGHTGLPSAELFTDLTAVEVGDTFELVILNEVYRYEVFNIVVVEPSEVDELEPVADKDLVTLVTCTPYGVNSHRLLVQGEQIEVVTHEAVGKEQLVQSVSYLKYLPYAIFVVVLILLIILLLAWPKKSKKNKQ